MPTRRLLSTSVSRRPSSASSNTAVGGLVLAGEFDVAGVDPASLPKDPIEAGRWMAKAAYLGHVSAQHKMGQAHEFAQLGEAFDPCVDVAAAVADGPGCYQYSGTRSLVSRATRSLTSRSRSGAPRSHRTR